MFKYFQRNKKNISVRVGRSPFAVRRLPSTVYCLFVFTLPLSLNVATGLMCLVLVVALFEFKKKEHRKSGFKPSAFAMLLPTFFFFLHLIALAYTSNMQAGVSELVLKSPLLIFPLTIWMFPPSKEELKCILMCFVVGCLLTSLVCFVRSSMNYYVLGRVSWVSYTWLSSQMGFLPAYLSMYMCLTVFIVLNDLKEKWESGQTWRKLGGLFALLFAGYMIVMLGARLVSVTFFMLLVGVFLVWMYQRRMLLKGLFAVIIFALGLWKLMSSFFVTRTRMNKIIGKQLNDYDHNFFININDPRGQIWESCLAVMERMPFWGYGIGDEVELVLLQMQASKNYHHLLTANTDAHSQYIQTFLSLGYIGLVCLVMMLVIPLYLSWKKRSYLHVLFLLLIMIPMLTECMLETPRGLFYFAFFNSLFCTSLFAHRT